MNLQWDLGRRFTILVARQNRETLGLQRHAREAGLTSGCR